MALNRDDMNQRYLCIIERHDYGDYEETQRNCSLEESLKGGNVSYSNEGLEGSVLTYHCKAREYPFPTAQRVCDRDGQWSAMRLPNGKRVFNAICKGTLSYNLLAIPSLSWKVLNTARNSFLAFPRKGQELFSLMMESTSIRFMAWNVHPFFCPLLRDPLSCPPSAWQWAILAQETVVQGWRAANVCMW